MPTNKSENILLLLHLSTFLSAVKFTALHAAEEGARGSQYYVHVHVTAELSHSHSLCNCCIKVILSLNQVKTSRNTGLDQAGRPSLLTSFPTHGESSQALLKLARAMRVAET